VTYKITRHGDFTLPGTVTYSTVDGTALAGTGGTGDYTKASGTLNFAAGDMNPQTVTVTVRDDAAHELSEDFLFTADRLDGGRIEGWEHCKEHSFRADDDHRQ
jgi:hypothetical protein